MPDLRVEVCVLMSNLHLRDSSSFAAGSVLVRSTDRLLGKMRPTLGMQRYCGGVLRLLLAAGEALQAERGADRV